jgi:hypothetical protein
MGTPFTSIEFLLKGIGRDQVRGRVENVKPLAGQADGPKRLKVALIHIFLISHSNLIGLDAASTPSRER